MSHLECLECALESVLAAAAPLVLVQVEAANAETPRGSLRVGYWPRLKYLTKAEILSLNHPSPPPLFLVLPPRTPSSSPPCPPKAPLNSKLVCFALYMQPQ